MLSICEIDINDKVLVNNVEGKNINLSTIKNFKEIKANEFFENGVSLKDKYNKTESSSINGKIKINNIETNVYTHPSYTEYSNNLYKITVDKMGHISNATTITKTDITNLGIAPLNSPILTGIPKVPTPSSMANEEQIANVGFVKSLISEGIAASDAMIIKGTIGTNGTITTLPTTYKIGWTYRVVTNGTYAGQVCEIGDLIIALVNRSGSNNLNSDWCVAQTNINGAITSVKSGDAYINCSLSGSTVTIIHKDITRTNTSSNSSPIYGGTFTMIDNITSDTKGHITGVNTKTVKLPNNTVTQSNIGLMSTSDKIKLDGIDTGAEVNQNTFSNITIGSTTIAADSKTDTLTLVAGANVTITADTTNDKITISSTDTNTHYTSKNVVGASASISNTSTALTNGSVYLNSVENGSVTSSHKISGSGGTTVTTDTSGNIIISSTDNNTTYTSGAGISVTGTTITNAGVRSISTGTANGTINVNTNGTSINVPVYGLGSAAYTNSTNYPTYKMVVSGDFNSMLTPGIYTMKSSTTNAPTTSGYYGLIVLKSDEGDYVEQIAFKEGTHEMYIRNLDNDEGWSVWQKINDGGNAATLNGKTISELQNYNNLTNKPTSLPANGGNADTLDEKHADDFIMKNKDITIFSTLNEEVSHEGTKTNITSSQVGVYYYNNQDSDYTQITITNNSIIATKDITVTSQNLIISGFDEISANKFIGSGGNLTSLNASNITSGTLSSSRLSTSGVTAGNYGPSTNVGLSHSGTFSVPYITVDTYGRITSASTKTMTLPSNENTHYTSHLYVGTSGGNTNATSNTSNPYLLCVDDTTNRNSIQLKAGSNMSISAINGIVTFSSSYSDTKNTAGSTNNSSKLYLIGATSQATNPQTYSRSTVYIGTDGCLYSNSSKVLTTSVTESLTINSSLTIKNGSTNSSSNITIANWVYSGPYNRFCIADNNDDGTTTILLDYSNTEKILKTNIPFKSNDYLYGKTNLPALLLNSSVLSELPNNSSTTSRYFTIDANGTIIKIMYGRISSNNLNEAEVTVTFPTTFSGIPVVLLSNQRNTSSNSGGEGWNYRMQALLKSVSNSNFVIKDNLVDLYSGFLLSEDLTYIYWFAIGI